MYYATGFNESESFPLHPSVNPHIVADAASQLLLRGVLTLKSLPAERRTVLDFLADNAEETLSVEPTLSTKTTLSTTDLHIALEYITAVDMLVAGYNLITSDKELSDRLIQLGKFYKKKEAASNYVLTHRAFSINAHRFDMLTPTKEHITETFAILFKFGMIRNVQESLINTFKEILI